MDNLRTNTFGIIVLNHNGMEDTLECLNSILSSELIPKEIVLIDNVVNGLLERTGRNAG